MRRMQRIRRDARRSSSSPKPNSWRFWHDILAIVPRQRDLLQTAYLKALTVSETVRNDEKVLAWFYRVLRNVVVDAHRHRAATERLEAQLIREAPRMTVPDEALFHTVCQCVLDIAHALKPEYRDILQRVEIEEASLRGGRCGAWHYAEQCFGTPAPRSPCPPHGAHAHVWDLCGARLPGLYVSPSCIAIAICLRRLQGRETRRGAVSLNLTLSRPLCSADGPGRSLL